MTFTKPVRWSFEKNIELRRERSISFEEILLTIENDGELARTDHPNADKYPNQKILYVSYQGYAYMVPYVETDEEVFLKTIIPSRKATKSYLKGSKNE